MRKNYRDTLSKARNASKKPNWMGEGVWNDLLRLWDSPPAKVSNICLLCYLNLIQISQDIYVIIYLNL